MALQVCSRIPEPHHPWRSATNVDPSARSMPASLKHTRDRRTKGLFRDGTTESAPTVARGPRVLLPSRAHDTPVHGRRRFDRSGVRAGGPELGRRAPDAPRAVPGAAGAVRRSRGIDAAGDGFLGAFGIASHAVAFACAFHEEVADLHLEVRTGVHTGECELDDGRLRGVAVHVAARLASLARPGEVLVSSTVRDVVAGSGLMFADRGLHELRGIPGMRRLFAARRSESGAFTRSERHGPRAAAGVRHRRQPVTVVETAEAG
jgi:class 3 adenylate cyclase